MTFKPGFKARILLGDFALYTKLSDISVPWAADMLDPTTFGDSGNKRALPGLDSSTFSCDGFIDADANAEAAAWTDLTPLTYGQQGLALGSPVILLNALKTSFEPGTQVAGVASFTLSGQTDGPTSFGVSLHDLEAETGDEDGSSVDNAAASSNGGVGHLHLTAYSGLTSAVVKIQHSANNSDWTDLISFTSATGATSERKTVTGSVSRYLRYSVDATGTGSATFAVAFARH